MKRLLLLGVLLSIGTGVSNSQGNTHSDSNLHDYRFEVHGTPGVRARLLLISKATEDANPDRREEIVTVPMKIELKAWRCYAWLDTLPNGASGNEGDVLDIDFVRDGHTASICTSTLQKYNSQSEGVGDL